MYIEMKREDLQAICVMAAKKDTRWYLNGVCFTTLHGNPVAIATDGHLMGILRLADETNLADNVPACGNLIVPIDVLELAAKTAKKGATMSITESMIGAVHGQQHTFLPIDGKFPDVTLIIPKEISGESVQFDPDLLARFKKVSKLIGAGYISVGYNGKAAAPVFVGDDRFFGVCMPLRTDGPASIPDWVLPPKEKKAAA